MSLKASGILLLLSIPTTAWAAFVLSILWAWFAEPIGAPHLSVARAAGFVTIVSTVRLVTKEPETHEDAGSELSSEKFILGNATMAVVAPAIGLGVGSIIHALL